MATLIDDGPREWSAKDSELKFFRTMALIFATVIVAGFSLNLGMGRSTFAVPAVYHIHAFVFFGWVALYVAQNWLIAGHNVRLHRTLGLAAYAFIPVMVVLGYMIMMTTLHRTGGPFFFDQNEFLFSNFMLLVLFGLMAFAALRWRRHTGWHRRLMFCAMTILAGPGLGRLLPMPLLIPHAWRIEMLVLMLFPLAGIIMDKRVHGRVHPAWFWSIGAIVVVQIASDLIAYSDWGVRITESVVAGTPGGERPMEAFLPPGF